MASDTSALPPADGAPPSTQDVHPTDAMAHDSSLSDAAGPSDASSTPPAYAQFPSGKITYDFLDKQYGEWVCAVLPQASGQVMLVGTTNTEWVSRLSTSANNAFTLVRLNADGKLDTSFGTAGKVYVTLTTHSLNACRAAVQTKDGKTLVAGDAIAHTSTVTQRNDDFVLARFNQDGTLDTGFANSGFAITDFPSVDTGKIDKVASLALLDDGRILVGGSTTVQEAPATTYPALARYTLDGAPDPSFGTAGMVTFKPASLKGAPASLVSNVSQTSIVSALLPEADGGAVVGLSVYGNISGYAIALLRLTPDGTPDTSFAETGSRWDNSETTQTIFDLAQLSRNPDGKLVALARTYSGRFELTRYSAQGLPDDNFGTAGRLQHPISALGALRALFMLRPSDGSFLIGLGATEGASNGAFGLLHVSAEGRYDEAFGEPTWSSSTSAVGIPHITAGALIPTGDIVVAGDITTKDASNTDTIALRLGKNAKD